MSSVSALRYWFQVPVHPSFIICSAVVTAKCGRENHKAKHMSRCEVSKKNHKKELEAVKMV